MASTPSKGQRFDGFRVLLGLIILALLIPAAALYTDSGMSPWGEAHASPPSSEEDGPPGKAAGKGETKANGDRGSPPDHSKGKGHQHATTTSSSATTVSTTTSTPDNTTTISTTTTTSATSTTTKASDTGVVDNVITGDACPCTVTGTVELQGSINLRGDLMVHGGTLVARPGVDLNGNGFQIMLMDGGRADFQGTPVFTWSDNGRSQNLARDINFRNLRRIMFHSGAGPSTLKYFSVADSGTSALGDYPLHWHLNGHSTRGTVVEGVVVLNGRHHAFVPHGSHGITFRDTIAKNISGDAYWWDKPGTNNCDGARKFCTTDNSNDIIIDRALCDGVTNGPGDDRGFRLSCFELNAGSGNVIRNSVARGVRPSHVKDCSGFQWPEAANQNIGGNVWVFENNRAEASPCHGIFVWQNDSNLHIIDGFVSLPTDSEIGPFGGGGIDHGAYGNNYDYRNVDVPYVEIHAEGWVMSDSTVGNVRLLRHVGEGDVVWTNVAIAGIIDVADAPSGSALSPIHFYINGGGNSCSQVVWSNPHPDTRVIIEGVEC